MILLSLNIRGVGGALKKASLRRLIDNIHPSIIFLQETLVDEQRSHAFINGLKPHWFVSAVNSVGTSGGLLVAWDPVFFYLKPFFCCGGILLTGTCCANKRQVNLLNVYGPCIDKLAFWSKVSASGLLAKPNLILAGDFNFTLSSSEIWGTNASTDATASQFSDIFQQHNLVDLLPVEVVPTWRNGRSGTTSISKRLDRFFLSDSLLQHADRYRTWVAYPYISDHAPIILQLDSYSHRSSYPFKFNPIWLGNPDFERLVSDVWTDQSYKNEPDVQRRISWKLKVLKSKVKCWARQQISKTFDRLSQLEHNIQVLILEISEKKGIDHINLQQHLKLLETERNNLLLIEEAHWHQKSRAIWINCGDNNTKFFHKFASHRRNHKHIWELQSDGVVSITGQENLLDAAHQSFQKCLSR
jgi:exonuclease III